MRISWFPNQVSDAVHGYIVWRRVVGGGTSWKKIARVQDVQDATEPAWDSLNGKFFYVDNEHKITKFCEDGPWYEYAVTAHNKNGSSGNPKHSDWGDHFTDANVNQGDPCSPGGTSVRIQLENCPPTPCVEPHDIRLCLDEDHVIDLSSLIGCIPLNALGEPVSVAYSIVSSAAWLTPSLVGSKVIFDTHNIDFGAVGAGPHNGAIVWRATISDSACAGTYDGDINITLVDCGCPCPDDEKDYTICDVNYDNAEYVADGRLTTIEQIPFSLGREGGQNLRKGVPYMLSKGKIDCP